MWHSCHGKLACESVHCEIMKPSRLQFSSTINLKISAPAELNRTHSTRAYRGFPLLFALWLILSGQQVRNRGISSHTWRFEISHIFTCCSFLHYTFIIYFKNLWFHNPGIVTVTVHRPANLYTVYPGALDFKYAALSYPSKICKRVFNQHLNLERIRCLIDKWHCL